MGTMKKAQSGITRRGMAGMKKLPSLNPKMVPGEMTGKMYKKSEIDEIGKKQAAELDKSGVFGKTAMAKKKAQNGVKKALTPAPKKKTGMEAVKALGKYVSTFGLATEKYNPAPSKEATKKMPEKKMKSGGKEMIKRADGSYSKRGLWDNIRAAKGSGKKPTAAMLKQEKKIKAKTKK
jgi:hypothetical protein